MANDDLLRAGASSWQSKVEREAQEQARRAEEARQFEELVQQRTQEAFALLERFRSLMNAAGNPGLVKTAGAFSKRAWRTSGLGFSDVSLTPDSQLKFGSKGKWRDASEWIPEFISCKHVGTYEQASPDGRLETLGYRLGQVLASNNVLF